MFDELVIERRPRWDDKSNKFLGVCREHRHAISLEFTSEDDLVILWEELESGKIHLSHEVHCMFMFVTRFMPAFYHNHQPVF